MISPDTRDLVNHFADAWALDSRMQNSFPGAYVRAVADEQRGSAGSGKRVACCFDELAAGSDHDCRAFKAGQVHVIAREGRARVHAIRAADPPPLPPR